MHDEIEDHALEKESDEVDLSLEDVVAGLQFRVLELERQVEALVDVVKPYDSRWWRAWNWQEILGVAAVLLGPPAFLWVVSSNPQIALPALMGITIVGVVVLAWVLYSVIAGLLSKNRERRGRAIDLGTTLILATGLSGLIPVSAESPTWQMPLWLALLLIVVGCLGFIRFFKKR